ncbi:MAG: hypothetical protein OSB03_00085 [Vicinamibacterales bacterium]|nr:hypothetical protein [Vicinamibacterales bacterium]
MTPRQTGRRWVVAALLLGMLWSVARAQAQFASENAAMGVLDAFMTAFNARDDAAMCGTFHYPHVRFASGAVRSYETFEDCVDQFDFVRFAERFGWDHSAWDRRTVVQAYPDKVHVVVIFSRYNATDERLTQFDSLYIVTRIDNRWGIRSRSSFAP